MRQLEGKKIAILLTDGFEQVEMTSPRAALDQAGARTYLISPRPDRVQGWNHDEKADFFDVDVPLDRADPNDFDALVLPGGVANPDKLRMNPKAVEFVKVFAQRHKPIAAICHGVWLLAEADLARNRRLTSYASIKTDLRNAGANWVDEEVVVDDGFITSRSPADLDAFNSRIIEEVSAPQHVGA